MTVRSRGWLSPVRLMSFTRLVPAAVPFDRQSSRPDVPSVATKKRVEESTAVSNPGRESAPGAAAMLLT